MQKREIKRGDILLNLWAGWQCLFVYFGSNKNIAYGVDLYKVNGEYKVKKGSFYRSDLNDEEHFPLVGHIDVKEMWKTTILNSVVVGLHNQHYDESGHRKCKN